MTVCDLGVGISPERCRQYRASLSATCRECSEPLIIIEPKKEMEVAERLKCDVEGCGMIRAKGPFCTRHHKDPTAPIVKKGTKPPPVAVSLPVKKIIPGKHLNHLQCPVHKVFYPLGEDCPECNRETIALPPDNPLDRLVRHREGMLLDLSDHPSLSEKLKLNDIDADRVIELLGWLVAGELERHPYRSSEL